MSYTMYTPLNVWLDPASVTDVVAYIQTYLSENTIYSETEIETIIHDYLIAHPELIGGVQSVNGKTGVVVLSASDINTEDDVTIESVLASLSSQISSIAASVATNTNNITSLTGRVSTAETDLSNLKSNNYKKARGKKIVIPNGIGNAIVTAPVGANVWYANNSKNLIKRSATGSNAPSIYGYHLEHNALNYLKWHGSATNTSTNNRFYFEGLFNRTKGNAGPVFVSDGSQVFMSCYADYTITTRGINFIGWSYTSSMSDSTVSGRVDTTAQNNYGTASFKPDNGQFVTFSLSEPNSGLTSGRSMDVDLYMFVSTDENDMVHIVNNGIVPLYENEDTIIVSDQIIDVEYFSKDIDSVDDSISVCAYNVGHFTNGGSTPIGTDSMLNSFVSTFQETGTSVYLFTEWDKDFSSTKTSTETFGKLRKYWSTQENKESNDYIFQKIASQYRILYEQTNYFATESSSYRSFLDCVVESKFGYNIHLISTHLTYHDHANRLLQIAEIINYLNDNGFDYTIIGGDFNNGLSTGGSDAPTTWDEALTMINSDISAWTNNGFISAQGGFFGNAEYGNYTNTFNTVTEIYPVKPYDNIIVSPSMQILNFKAITNNESDHKAVIAIVKIN